MFEKDCKGRVTVLSALLLISLVVAPLGCQSNSVETATTEQRKMVDTLTAEEGFMFRGIEWFSSEQEVLEHEGISQEEIIRFPGETVKNPSKVSFDGIGATLDIAYEFSDGKFVAGRYLVALSSEEEFLKACESAKNELLKQFGDPFMDGIDDLTRVPRAETGGRSATWLAEDDSGLEMATFNNKGIDERNPPYILVITALAPRACPKSLRPEEE